jgi:hypothetical protein
MDLERVPATERPTDTPLTSKRVYYGSPPDVDMRINPQTQLGLAWLLNRIGGFFPDDVTLRHRGGPWLEVDTTDPHDWKNHWAIWIETGAVYKVDSGGAVEDDPMYDPTKPTGQRER